MNSIWLQALLIGFIDLSLNDQEIHNAQNLTIQVQSRSQNQLDKKLVSLEKVKKCTTLMNVRVAYNNPLQAFLSRFWGTSFMFLCKGWAHFCLVAISKGYPTKQKT